MTLLFAAILITQLDTAPLVETPDSRPHQLGLLLRCPVCQGMPIAESPSEMAQEMMRRVRGMVAEGKSDQEILDYFVGRYGEWVLLAPRPAGMNLGLWVLPALALLVGVIWVVRFARRGPPAAPPPSQAPPDPYVRAIREEIDE